MAFKLTEKDREWARGFNVTKEILESWREELLQANAKGTYIVYGKDIKAMDDDEIKVAYSNMKNYLSDCHN